MSAVDRVPLHGVSPRRMDQSPGDLRHRDADDEQTAREVGAIEVLPPQMRRYVAALWESAVAATTQLDFPIDGAEEDRAPDDVPGPVPT